MIEVKSDNDGIEVQGFIGRTDNFKANRNYQNFFINGRYVKSKTAMAALEQAYTSYMPPEKFPCCVLYITINPARVDVNVHPAKLEVKFSNEKAVFESIYYTVRTALESNATRPSVELNFATRGAKKTFGSGRVSDQTVPVREGRMESLASRQISYDLEGRTQPQPQMRMTAEEYRERFSSNPTPRAPERVENRTASRPPQPIEVREPTVNNSGHTPRVEVPTQPVFQTTSKQEKPADHTPAESIKVSVEPTSSPITAQTPDTADVCAVNTEIPAEAPKTPENTTLPIQEEPVRPLPSYRIVGEVFHSYVIVEVEDKMLLVDKHAAHERIIFEQLKAGLKTLEVCSQLLMLPIDVMLTSGEVEALKEYAEELERIGFSLRFARNTVSVDAIPEGVENAAVADMLGTMAGRILNATGSVKLTRDIIFEKALYQAACKAAIKAGREYADGHIQWIIGKLMEIPDITFCPHGRPVALELSHHTLDKQFDRTGF